ncbi:MAG: lysoplasmalogenase [Anaerolineae bacterium]|nr:lysoplasmalogenase [Anaerolineae bacterium]
MAAGGWLVVAGLAALGDWLCAWRGWRRGLWLFKPLTIIGLLAWGWAAGGYAGGMIWFGLALVFSLVGDIFLMLSAGFFMAGVGAFWLAHLAYIVGLNQGALAWRWLPAAMIVVFLVSFGLLLRWGVPQLAGSRLSRRLQKALLAYALFLGAMVVSALFTGLRPSWSLPATTLVSLGALLFFASDGLLAYDRFISKLPRGQFMVHVLYHCGQACLLAGGMIGLGTGL